MERLKRRWGLTTNFHVVLIILVFSINGTFVAWVGKPVTELIGFNTTTTSPWIYWPFRILFPFVIYQVTLPIVGFCFGQFRFFWNFTKKSLQIMGFRQFIKEN